MNRLKVYPSCADSDFSADVLKQAQRLITSSADVLEKELPQLYNNKQKDVLLCAARLTMEQPLNELNASLLGWFIINEIIPVPTQILLLNVIVDIFNTKSGFSTGLAFIHAILPQISRYVMFCKKIVENPALAFYDRELFLLLNQVAYGDPITIESYSLQYHFVPPKKMNGFLKHTQRIPDPISGDAITKTKNNVISAINYASELKGEQQRQFLIQICLRFKPPINQNIPLPPLLQAACDYTIILLNSLKGHKWESFDAYPWLERLGQWVNAMTIAVGRPPPIWMIDIPGMLKDAAKSGIFGPAMVFMTSFFSQFLSIYAPPCPYTTACLEIMAAVLNEPGIRSDIITLIKNFGQMLDVDVNLYYRRKIDIPADSFDRCAAFVSTGKGKIFKKVEGNEKSTNTEEDLSNYFSYKPDITSLSGPLKEITEKANEVEKYYFVGKPTNIIALSRSKESNLSLLQKIVSLALSDTTVVSETALSLFKDATENIKDLDLSGIFRVAFPNPMFFPLIIERGFYDIKTISDLFCDLLSNPKTSEIAKPYICNYITILPESKELKYVYSLLGSQEKVPDEKVPQPDKAYLSLLQSFFFLCKKPSDSARLEFANQLSPATPEQMKTMLLAIIQASIKANNNNYDIVDFFAHTLVRCSIKITPESVIYNTHKAIESLSPLVFKTKKVSLIIFRFLYSYLNGVTMRQPEKLLALCTTLSPQNYPNFTCCWIQLCMHRQCFQQFVKKNEQKFVQFCISFVSTLIELAITIPEGFYKQVASILMVIANDCPSFFVQFYGVFICKLPLRYIQFRNIILGAQIRDFDSSKAPFIDFEYATALEEKTLILNIKPFLKTDTSGRHVLTSNTQFIASTLRREAAESKGKTSLFFKFVLYCIVKTENILPTENIVSGPQFSSLPIVGLFKQLAAVFGVEAGKLFINGIIDQIRFPSTYTALATEVLFTIFNESPNYVREMIYTELARRLTCVTQPPRAVKALYIRIVSKYKQEIIKMFEQSGQLDSFERISKAVNL